METKLPLPILAVENADANDNGAFLGVCNHTAYYFHYDVGGATTLDHDFLASVKTVAESYVIYADACAVSEEFLTKHRITFKRFPGTSNGYKERGHGIKTVSIPGVAGSEKLSGLPEPISQ